MFSRAEKFFGPIPARPLPERKPQDEPPQRGIKRVTVKAPAELPYVLMAYRAPVLRDREKDWEPYALEMLAGVLDGNDAARLNRELVRDERIANGAGASYDGVNRGGLFYLDGNAGGRHDRAGGRAGACATRSRAWSKEGVSEEELQRVKAQVVARQVFYQRLDVFPGDADRRARDRRVSRIELSTCRCASCRR